MSALPSLTIRSAAASLMTPLSVPTKLLTGPGPSNQHPAVTAALASPLLGHLHPEFTKIMDDVKEGIRYFFQTKNDWSFAISGTGHCAMEAACMNLLEPGETVLICRNGIWGDRFAELSRRLSLNPVLLSRPPGRVFSLAEVEAALVAHRPRVAFVAHGESSTGALQPLDGGLGGLCRRHGCLLLVDSVAAAGGAPLLTDAWEIDCVYTGSQKCLSCTPGLGLISFSEAARRKILSRSAPPPSWYLDARQLANYWGCRTDEPEGQPVGPRRYHHTAPVSLVCAMREALRLAAEEGLPQMWARHALAAGRLRDGLRRRLGLRLLVPDAGDEEGGEPGGCWAPTVTTVMVPEGVDWREVCRLAMARHSVEISGGLGPTAGQVWRIGLMGVNATEATVDRVLAAFEDAYRSVAKATTPNL